MNPKTLTNIRADSATIELTDHTSEPASAYIAAIRPDVAKFAIEMETVLRENDHKTGWKAMEYDTLFRRIKDEFEELQDAQCRISSHLCDRADPVYIQAMRRESLDIANFCMFLCHNYPKMEEV
jgi:hypothetical protein